ncbi:MAG: hypothetical protein VR72_09575 [Clostridiaceae bacterium BRH_c20a]|nr:MAG: hypothetical protein VR72_09575 [Clostridiaceae bacterium BRH_c20a]
MEDNKSILLNPKEALEIVELVKTERRRLDLGMGPIGEKIFSVFRDNNIQLLYFALEPKHPNSLTAFYLEKYSSVTGIHSYYIAINSMVPLDLQIFNSCHEYYHHIDEIDENLHLRRFGDSDVLLINAKANRFAAEFLLPTETLATYVKKHNRGNINLGNWNNHALLRLIAQLQIDYQVPYRMIVKRLQEIESINMHVKKELLSIDERDSQSSYYKIGSTWNSHIFHKLNSITDKTGVEPEALNVILKNFDEGITTIDSTVKDLNIFNKKLEDFGYEIEILDDDIDEILDLFGDDK